MNRGKPGDPIRECPRCGFTLYRRSEHIEEWTGQLVCPRCYDPKHPLIEKPPLEPDDTFVDRPRAPTYNNVSEANDPTPPDWYTQRTS